MLNSFPTAKIKQFKESEIKNMSMAKFEKAIEDGIVPAGSYFTTPFVEYVNLDGKMVLPTEHMIRGVVVREDGLKIKNPTDVKKDDLVLIADEATPEFGIYRDEDIFSDFFVEDRYKPMYAGSTETYKRLFKMMKEVKERDGKIAWVLGPAVVFDHDTRLALSDLAKDGYVDLLLAGNAMATHDLEGGYLNTALGQNIYTQESVPNGHYNHLDLLNEARHYDSLKDFIDSGLVKNGFIKQLVEENIPIVLCGSIRDDGPLPEVYHRVSEGLSAMREALKDCDIIITLATLLHSVSSASVAPTYRVKGDDILGTYICSIDITDYATNSVINRREGFLVDSIVTNVQDFCVNTRNNMESKDKEGRIK